MAENRVFLLPGEYHVSRRPVTIATLLGSCVAVCLYNRQNGAAAMNHFLLPETGPRPERDRGHYGDSSTQGIIDLMLKLDAERGHLTARVYGGAAVVGHLDAARGVGARNAEVALAVLKKNGLRVVENDLGGFHGRRLYFDTAANSVTVRKVKKTQEAADLAARRADIAGRDTRILVVDDSPLVRRILRTAIEQTPGLDVCGEAADAFEARDLILSENPDVVSLDIIMPKLDGLKFLRKLMEHHPKPVVICSTIAKDGSDVARRALEYGAVGVVDKDSLRLYEGFEVVKNELIPKLRLAAAKAVRKLPGGS
jgi:two-component system, chemotaxis family, protein-glutamate methylesterase/glutaminase